MIPFNSFRRYLYDVGFFYFSWQIKPRNLHVSNFERAVESALRVVARDLGTEVDYEVKANLYKLLLYEPGCFFARHRDSERVDGMFATLVLELPSIYQGAELSVYSPLTPGEKETYTFNGGGNAKSNTKRRSNRLCSPKLHFAAFYADCYHEVSKLTSGHRVALVYHLTANPRVNRLLPHLPVPSPSPPQPADESIARRLSKLVEMFSKENDNAYPNETSCDGKPKKLVVVLSHNYSPASLTGIQSLKGSDRSIAELIRAAACYPPKDVLSSLTNLAARKVVEEGGERYATDPECSLSHELVSNALKRESSGPYFDAVISLANVWDEGECTPHSDDTFCTTGSLISITADHSPLDLGPELQYDIEAAYHQSWFGGEDHLGPPFQYHGPTDVDGPLYNVHGRLIYGEQFLMDDEWTDYCVGQGNHVIPIYSHELLFASEEASRKYRDDILQWGRKKHKKKVIVDEPQAVEFCEYLLRRLHRILCNQFCILPLFLLPIQSEMGCNTWVGCILVLSL